LVYKDDAKGCDDSRLVDDGHALTGKLRLNVTHRIAVFSELALHPAIAD